MRFMVMVKATEDSEAGIMPDEELLTAMGNYNEQLVKAGVLLAGEGLHPSSKGARVRFSGTDRTVIDGPFSETKELVAGYCGLPGAHLLGGPLNDQKQVVVGQFAQALVKESQKVPRPRLITWCPSPWPMWPSTRTLHR
ncbi:hypothetical protein BH23ACT12_BH23ACT12_12990 [soil metagenome]